MKRIVALVASVGVAAVMAGVTYAEGEAGCAEKGCKDKVKEHKMGRFEKADANKDGKLSLDEFKTMHAKPNAEEVFKTADTDKDGFLTPAELKAFHEARKAARKGADKPAKAEAAKGDTGK